MWLHVPREALSASAPESAGSISDSPPPAEWSLWCTSSGKPSLQPSSWPGWKKRGWHKLLSGTTCAPSTLAHGVDWWISSLAERRARISASPGSALGWMAAGAGSSSSTSGSPSSVKPPSSSGRTSPEQLGLFPESASTSKSAATEARGPSFVRVMLGPLTSGPESSSWPTPNTGESTSGHGRRGGKSGNGHQSGADLETVARVWSESNLWPTPRASPNENRTTNAPTHGNGHGETLAGTASDWTRENIWPTATAMDSRSSGAASYSTDSGRHSGTTLTDAVRQFAANLWPTASARDWKSGEASQDTLDRNSRPLNETATDWARSHLAALTSKDGPECLRYDPTSHRLSLNPAFVEWLMGWSDGHTMPYASTGSAPAETESSQPKPRMHGAGSGPISSGESCHEHA